MKRERKIIITEETVQALCVAGMYYAESELIYRNGDGTWTMTMSQDGVDRLLAAQNSGESLNDTIFRVVQIQNSGGLQ